MYDYHQYHSYKSKNIEYSTFVYWVSFTQIDCIYTVTVQSRKILGQLSYMYCTRHVHGYVHCTVCTRLNGAILQCVNFKETIIILFDPPTLSGKFLVVYDIIN